ncbi:MAG: tetratricopeptide repeat protein, partial [Flavobacterium sp.]
MNLKRVLLLLVLITFYNAKSQNIDSLMTVARTTKNDSAAIKILNSVAYYSIFNDTKKAYSTLQEAKRRAIKAKLNYNYIELTNTEGVYYDVTGKRDSAMYFFSKALSLSRKEGFIELETRTTNNLGMLNWNMGDFNEALKYFFKALKLNEKLPEKTRVPESTMLGNIGLIYQEMGQHDKALEFHKKAFDYRKADNRILELPGCINNIAICYGRLGKTATAIEKYKEGIELAKQYKNYAEYYKLLENYSGILIEQKQFKVAISYLLEALNRPAEIPFPEKSKLSIYSELANAYNNLGQSATALKYAKLGLPLAEGNPDLKNYSGDLYLGLSHAYYMLGDEDRGQEYIIKFAGVTKDRFSSENASEMADLEVKFETEKKERLLAQ